MIIADLHIHSRFSRATARSLDPEHLWLGAQLKGVDLLGTGDFTHPTWAEELKEKLEETGDGAYRLRPNLQRALEDQVPGPCRREVRFLLSGEISCIYKRGGKTRKIHALILMPDLAAVERLNATLARLGNIKSDGRPILGLDARDLLEICLAASPQAIFIPAHIWTPWFSLFGSKSGFDSIEECFGDLSGHIQALETGLSSDPAMNWRLSALDRFTLVSHSDAHSPANLAREANLLNCAPTYPALFAALADRAGDGFAGTLEFFPDEGKYHLDGHRKCNQRLMPQQTRDLDGRCPVCGGEITVGVLSRVEELADRPMGFRPPGARPFESIMPLPEVLGEALGRGPATKGVQEALKRLLERLGPELHILRESPLEDLERAGGPLLREAMNRLRGGRVTLEGGYDGEFGHVGLFSPAERRELAGQEALWQIKAPSRGRAPLPAPPLPAPRVTRRRTPPLLTALDPALEGLNPEQLAGVQYDGGHLMVRAGPGTGKTRLLVQRALALLEGGLAPERLLLITFTRKAAREMAERLASARAGAGGARVATFHALGRDILAQTLGREPQVADEAARLVLLTPLAQAEGIKPGDLAQVLTRAKQRLEAPDEPQLAAWLDAYQARLAQAGLWDLDDLVREAALSLSREPDLATSWRGRFAHILVDEYQDVNAAQVSLLRALTGEATQVLAIGDPDQAIYGFRGAQRSRLLSFAHDFPGARSISLQANYRSSAPILALAHALLAPLRDPQRVQLEAMRGDGPLPLACQLQNPEAEARWVAARVASLLGGLDSRQVEAGGGRGVYAPAEIAVLYRLHAQAPLLASALMEAGVPVQVCSQEPLAETEALDWRARRVSLLTMHAAKGLEFPVVFVTGLEQGLLPYEPPGRPPAEEAEERRLLYVALTRAERELYLSQAAERFLFGQRLRGQPSPFWQDLPDRLLRRERPGRGPRRARQLGLF
jgi:DNA helicase-2/ATP-dependent DNA helicase PcrA